MPKQVQLRRGTTTDHTTFTGVVGEVTIDTTKDTAVVHDGSQVGGYPLARESALANYQPLDGDLTAIAALAGTTGIVRKTAANTYSLDTATYLTDITSGQVTTALGFTPYNATNPSNYLSTVSLTSNVTGTLPITNGGTNATTAADALTALGAYPAANPNSYTSNTGTVTSVNLTAGTGVSVSGGPVTSSGAITVTNTAPDQVVSLTGAGTTTITGTYPSFTITSADSTVGTVTSVGGTGTINGITLTGTVTASGSLTLGGTLSGVDLTSQVTGTLPVANGGTGAATLTGYVKGTGTSAMTAAAAIPVADVTGAAPLASPTFTGTATFATTDALGPVRGNITAVAALDIDCSAGNYFTKTIAANSTFTFSNVPSTRAFAFTLELTHTSGTVTWPTTVRWPGGTAPTLTTSRVHLFTFVTDDAGTIWRAASQVNYTA
jgi:hypothetical protein